MASITLSQLNVTGSELFQDSESYLDDLNDASSVAVHGGYSDSHHSGFGAYGDFGVKYLEYLVGGYAIASIKSIAKSFSHSDSASTGHW
ncbi:hypothetical protein [Dolichospermum circinale]|uniref:Uncharacterized protein n=1 Tax=Dolichospermum circinale CS-537/01 TaxID=3021739 RepID=A0ABT5AAV1_9CYAN|nr:hypothetical protein [Dolichospermum circinale]MDB9457441.1 hypothetical protein [Dolichospermum circinale CS-545/17]MDB9466360.1 hypothetical protein [Dolichospermum circinale CS-539/09]MDB9470068.1 hypothetical protein [Dolichospermum circinale CS-539]MDB9488670.1 hypothetical protein [Dolichospermum circinale CS-537/01]